MPHRVAIVVRTKDRPYFLRRALADITAQSFQDAEVVVVNDGGERAELERVVADASIRDRVTVIESEGPGGRCAAANTGLRSTKAPFVVLHDDDDLWHPAFLETTVAVLDGAPTAAGAMVPTEIVIEEDRGGEWTETERVPFWAGLTEVGLSNLLEVNRAVPISFLYRRDLHEQVGFYDEALETVEDWDFYLRVAAVAPIVFIPGTALAYWTHRPAARGADANSMFELDAAHRRDDIAVRERELRGWVAREGLGLPLYLAAMEQRIVERTVEATVEATRRLIQMELREQREAIASDLLAAHPIWSRLRRLRSRLRSRVRRSVS
ncbi:glycosyltransferase family 2 protein [Naasia lichenicola]|uniref:Glycosyltransferase family 2 protein n=1 Tax=Naasia lichenicola TaxID=2565933 RepID=A0A4S4FMZ2_9MICO|nr:glycosyltransferase family A protein [Naasia lichenicola]THG30825.1 glycosyltransferase family 2 protein [Naasia lichenicola]